MIYRRATNLALDNKKATFSVAFLLSWVSVVTRLSFLAFLFLLLLDELYHLASQVQ